MAQRFSSGEVAVDVVAVKQEVLPKPDLLDLRVESSEPFRILLLGDFSGRGDGKSGPMQVDRDNLDDVLAAFQTQANLRFAEGAYPLPLRALEDFEPDNILRQYSLFRGLAEGHPTTPPSPEQRRSRGGRDLDADARRLTSGSLLDDILEQQGTAREQPAGDASREDGGYDLRSIIDRAIEPYLLKRDATGSKRSQELQQKKELLLRAVMRDETFRALEANWRSVDFLVRRLEIDESLQIFLFDISKENLASELIDKANLHSTGSYRGVVENCSGGPGQTCWAVIVGLFAFDRSSRRDVELLGNLGLLARAVHAPFLAECLPEQGGDAAHSEAWQALRESAYANWIGLAIPRFLLRLPYGKESLTVESFPFEEMPASPEHELYLWGNPAVACAYLLGAAFSDSGWHFRPGLHRDIEDLPLHIYRLDGVARTQPCAEVLLNDSGVEHLLDGGLIPLASERDRDVIRLVRFQSIAHPAAPLSGRWVHDPS